MNQITEGELYKRATQIPDNFEEFYQGVLETMDNMIKEDKEKKQQKR
jgi:hypothetical protein